MNDTIIKSLTGKVDFTKVEHVEVASTTNTGSTVWYYIAVFVRSGTGQVVHVINLLKTELSSPDTTHWRAVAHVEITPAHAGRCWAKILKPGSGLRARHDLAKSLWTAITGKPHPHDV